MRAFSAATVAVVLALAPAASAKEIAKAELCGTDGCATIDQADHRLLGGGPTDPPDRPGRFYELNLSIEAGDPPGSRTETLTNQVLVAEGLMRAEGGWWTRLDAAAAARLQGAAAGLTPFPAHKLLEVAPEMPQTTAPARPVPPDDGGGPGALLIGALVAGVVAALGLVAARLSARRRRAVPQP